jgi:hypothetical protein
MTESLFNKQIYTLHLGDDCGFSELDVKRRGNI